MSRGSEAVEITGELDERDVAILVELARRKLLTTEHIHSLFFRSLRRTQAKVQELREVGLLELFPRAREEGDRIGTTSARSARGSPPSTSAALRRSSRSQPATQRCGGASPTAWA